jgi:hypothetical protein
LDCNSFPPNSTSLEMFLEDNIKNINRDLEWTNGLRTRMAVCRSMICRVYKWLIREIYTSVSCSQYLCPQTLDCVAKPTDCPCPNAEDIKCIIPDPGSSRGEGTVVCSRGRNDCLEVERLMKKGLQGKKKWSSNTVHVYRLQTIGFNWQLYPIGRVSGLFKSCQTNQLCLRSESALTEPQTRFKLVLHMHLF